MLEFPENEKKTLHGLQRSPEDICWTCFCRFLTGSDLMIFCLLCSSDWDAEVRQEEEQAELMRLQQLAHSADAIYQSDGDSDSDTDDDGDDVLKRRKHKTSKKLKHIAESQSELETSSDDDNVSKIQIRSAVKSHKTFESFAIGNIRKCNRIRSRICVPNRHHLGRRKALRCFCQS